MVRQYYVVFKQHLSCEDLTQVLMGGLQYQCEQQCVDGSQLLFLSYSPLPWL